MTVSIVERSIGLNECWTCYFSDENGCRDPFLSSNSGISKKPAPTNGWCIKVIHDKNYERAVARGPAPDNECVRLSCFRTTRRTHSHARTFLETELDLLAANQRSRAFYISLSQLHQQNTKDPRFNPPPKDEDWKYCCNGNLCNRSTNISK
ncbi:unnamed protein product, partial [Rotaria sp. Silwood2]